MCQFEKAHNINVCVRGVMFQFNNANNLKKNWMYPQVYYEQLVLHPEEWMRKILKFLDIPWNESVLHHEEFINKPNGVSLSKYACLSVWCTKCSFIKCPNYVEFMRIGLSDRRIKWLSPLIWKHWQNGSVTFQTMWYEIWLT